MRRYIQFLWVFLTNGYWKFLGEEKIYTGPLKGFCAPGLNCYACPAATLSCPIGAIQHFLSNLRFNWQNGLYVFGFYVLGTIVLIGSFIGRMACGWACPFGLLQEILYKIPSPKFSLPKSFSLFKYGILLFLVFLLPALVVNKMGFGIEWFCRYICPVGTLEASLPLLILIPTLKQYIGWIFYQKLAILAAILIMMLFFKRPFCRLLCPLGAFYGLFNHFSLLRMHVDKTKCKGCNLCYIHCPMGIKIYENPNQMECIRCFTCRNVCPEHAIFLSFGTHHTMFSKDSPCN